MDRVQQLVGGTCTIFQRLEGDRLLRISTNVLRADGSRAVGTYIPASSEVARAIFRGETYRGRAYVVNAWYITVYEPIHNEKQEVIGALYVGIPEQSAVSIKDGDQIDKDREDAGTPTFWTARGDWFSIRPKKARASWKPKTRPDSST